MNRKEFISQSLTLGAGAPLVQLCQPSDAVLTILHANDMYSYIDTFPANAGMGGLAE